MLFKQKLFDFFFMCVFFLNLLLQEILFSDQSRTIKSTDTYIQRQRPFCKEKQLKNIVSFPLLLLFFFPLVVLMWKPRLKYFPRGTSYLPHGSGRSPTSEGAIFHDKINISFILILKCIQLSVVSRWFNTQKSIRISSSAILITNQEFVKNENYSQKLEKKREKKTDL